MNTLPKNLLIDDDTDIHNIVRTALLHLTDVDVATNSKETFLKLEQNSKYDLIIFDLNLAEESGMELLKDIKNISKYENIPKLILTASQNEEDEIKGHRLEVDDYIHKPIRAAAFRAQIEKHIKKKSAGTIHHYGPLTIDVSSMKVILEEDIQKKHELTLTLKEYKILLKLVQAHGKVLDRENMFHEIWDEESDGLLRTIDTHVSTLRKKLGVHGHALQSVRGVGYSLNFK
jgi:DNA-binding response OmpR family regulator